MLVDILPHLGEVGNTIWVCGDTREGMHPLWKEAIKDILVIWHTSTHRLGKRNNYLGNRAAVDNIAVVRVIPFPQRAQMTGGYT